MENMGVGEGTKKEHSPVHIIDIHRHLDCSRNRQGHIGLKI